MATTLAHMYRANDVSDGRAVPWTKGSLPPTALGFLWSRGNLEKNMEFSRSFITGPLVQAWLGKGPSAGR